MQVRVYELHLEKTNDAQPERIAYSCVYRTNGERTYRYKKYSSSDEIALNDSDVVVGDEYDALRTLFRRISKRLNIDVRGYKPAWGHDGSIFDMVVLHRRKYNIVAKHERGDVVVRMWTTDNKLSWRRRLGVAEVERMTLGKFLRRLLNEAESYIQGGSQHE